MSTFDRIKNIGKAYGNRGFDEIEKFFGRSPESDARAELDSFLGVPPVATGGGQVLTEPEPQTGSTPSATPNITTGIAWAYQALGLPVSASMQQVEEAYAVREKRMQGLIRTCNKRIKEADDEETKEHFSAAKVEARDLREKLKEAFRAIKAERDTVFARFHDLEVDEPEKNRAPKTKAPSEKSSLDAKTVDRFRELELD